MTKRMTAEEVADLMEKRCAISLCEAKNAKGTERAVAFRVEELAFRFCASQVRGYLIPQWQDKPDGDGWYWVEGSNDPYRIIKGEDDWLVMQSPQFPRELQCRRVCPIGARPQ